MNKLETTKKCPHCGMPNPNSLKECEVCQTPLTLKQFSRLKTDNNFTILKVSNLLKNVDSLFEKLPVSQKAKIIKLLNLVGIGVILFIVYLWTNRLIQKRVVTIEDETPQIVFTEEIAGVERVPQGIFNYSGEGYFAAFLQRLQEEITPSFPNFEIEYIVPFNRDPSYSVAIEMLIEGEVDFVFNGRALNPAEYNKAQLQGLELYSQPIARDGIVFYYGENLGVDKLSIEQIQAIFQGKITNWQQLGGKNLPIVPVILAQENASDLGFEVDSRQNNIKYVPNHTIAAREVITIPGAFSYASASLLQDQSLLNFFALGQVSRDNWQQTNYVVPFKENRRINREAMENGSYPITRRLFVVYSDREQSQLAGVAMSNLLLSSQGQSILKRSGFIGLRKE